MVIKIRAYHLEDKKMVPPVDVAKNTLAYLQEAKHLKLMMFTGLQDKHGKEIYEGDILNSDYKNCSKGVVEYQSGCFGMDEPDEGFTTFEHIIEKDWEIIGNIYENPELEFCAL